VDKVNPALPSDSPFRPSPDALRPWSDLAPEGVWFNDRYQLLIADFQESCGTGVAISTWDDGLRVFRWNENLTTWDEDEWDPGISLWLAETETYAPAVQQFSAGIPIRVLRGVQPFQWRQFVLLRMVRRAPQTIELLESNPMLAWILADTITTRQIPISDAVGWVFKRRREILAFCTEIDSESVVRTLSMIRGDEYGQNVFVELKGLLSNPQSLTGFQHAKIHTNKLHLIREYPDFVRWVLGIVHEKASDALGDDSSEGGILDVWWDTMNLGKELRQPDFAKRVFECRSIAALCRLHDRWTEALNATLAVERLAVFKDRYGLLSFPAPPRPGNEDIVPVLSIDELILEGKIMHNCVASYAENIMERECFIYRVLKPERATLDVGVEDGVLVVRELRTVCNGEPSDATKECVADWLRTVLGGS